MFKFILLAQLALSPFDTWDTPDFREWFKKAKVGESRGYSQYDGCNTCSGSLQKVSETQVAVGPTVSCTLRGCMVPNIYEIEKPNK